MKTTKRVGLIGIFCLSFLSNGAFAFTLPNSSVDVTYNGIKILDHYSVTNAHKTVAKLDDAKVAFEAELKNLIINEGVVTSVSYAELGGDIKLQFSCSNNGLVNIELSGISIDTSGKGKKVE